MFSDQKSLKFVTKLFIFSFQRTEQITLANENKESQNSTEKRMMIMVSDMEEMGSKCDDLENNKRAADSELLDAENTIGDLRTENSNLVMTMKKLESSMNELRVRLKISNMSFKILKLLVINSIKLHIIYNYNFNLFQAEIENHSMEMKQQEDLRNKVHGDLARLNADLKREKENGFKVDKQKRTIEIQLKEMQLTYEESESGFNKGEKMNMQRLEGRIKALEAELENEHRHRQETERNLRKQERSLKDYVVQSEEDKKIHEKLMEDIEDMNKRLRVYKQQLEESVQIKLYFYNFVNSFFKFKKK